VSGPPSGTTVVYDEKLFSVVEPSRLTSMVNAKPSVVSLVSTGVVPAGSENMPKAVEAYREGDGGTVGEIVEVVVEAGAVVECQRGRE